MNSLVLYYSRSGHTARIAEHFAQMNGAAIIEVTSKRRIGTLYAFVIGCFKAMRGKPMPIAPIAIDVTEYEELYIFAPIWAGSIAPPMVAALAQLSAGAKLHIRAVSASGKSDKPRVIAKLAERGIEVVDYEDIKG